MNRNSWRRLASAERVCVAHGDTWVAVRTHTVRTRTVRTHIALRRSIWWHGEAWVGLEKKKDSYIENSNISEKDLFGGICQNKGRLASVQIMLVTHAETWVAVEMTKKRSYSENSHFSGKDLFGGICQLWPIV